MDEKRTSPEDRRYLPKIKVYLGGIATVVTIGVSLAAIFYHNQLLNIAHLAGYGLLGVFLIAFVAGSVFSFAALPVPYWLLVFALPSVLAPQWGLLAPVLVGFTSALGTSLGHLPTFMIGYTGGKTYQIFGGRQVDSSVGKRVSRLNLYSRAIEWAQSHGSWAAFAMSAMFNPLHLPMTVAIGALRYPPQKFFLFSFLGNAVKGLFLAFAGYFGLTSLFSLLNG